MYLSAQVDVEHEVGQDNGVVLGGAVCGVQGPRGHLRLAEVDKVVRRPKAFVHILRNDSGRGAVVCVCCFRAI